MVYDEVVVIAEEQLAMPPPRFLSQQAAGLFAEFGKSYIRLCIRELLFEVIYKFIVESVPNSQ